MSTRTPISIDLSELQAEFNLKQTQVTELGMMLVNQITDRIFYNWQNAAMNGLNSSRKQYINSLNIGQVSPTRKYIQLTGSWANMLEEGFGAYDMKPGMLASPKAKVTKKGVKYIVIPFRWGTPGSIGESEVFANVMPRDIYAVARQLRPTITNAQGVKTQKGGSLKMNQIPADYRVPQTRPAFSDIKTQTTYPEYVHQGPISEGMQRNQKTYESATQGSYVTFRRVSDNSNPNSWIHRGVAAKNFADAAVRNTDVGMITDRTIDAYLQNI